mmetsp:Transcript_4370/g.7783  ORF Transcript_4370/g.7783 Transcript_4370/m.7783 type:complete len:99 (+) Transcript_4370:882-1178(+)
MASSLAVLSLAAIDSLNVLFLILIPRLMVKCLRLVYLVDTWMILLSCGYGRTRIGWQMLEQNDCGGSGRVAEVQVDPPTVMVIYGDVEETGTEWLWWK